MNEQRAAPRQRTFLRGTIPSNDHQKSLECIVRDLSDGGARLEFPVGSMVPDTFELYVPKNERSHLSAVKWRRGDEIGIEFQKLVRGSRDDILRRLETLEAEVAVLRRHARQRRQIEETGVIVSSLPSRVG